MIDRNTGRIRFDDSPLELGPEFTLTRFLASELSAHATVNVQNGPWKSWHLKCVDSGLTFHCTVYFHGEDLRMVYLSNADEQYGRSWADYSDEAEGRRKASHDKWLADTTCGLRPGKYPWGTVSSVFGPKIPWGNVSVIVIKYGPSAAHDERHQFRIAAVVYAVIVLFWVIAAIVAVVLAS